MDFVNRICFHVRMVEEQSKSLIPIERIANSIYLIRGEKVMIDSDLAALYGVETKMLVRAMKRNQRRFPDDFAFQLTKEEFEHLRFQFGTSSQWGVDAILHMFLESKA